MSIKVTTYNIRSGAIRWQLPDFLSDGNSNVYSVSHRLRDMRKQEKCQNVDLENEGQVQGSEERDLCHSTRNIRIHLGEFFRSLVTWQHKFTQRLTHTHTPHTHTHTHTHIHTQKDRGLA